MCERTNELPDDAIREMLELGHAIRTMDSTMEKGYTQLATLQSAAQGVTLDEARKVLPATSIRWSAVGQFWMIHSRSAEGSDSWSAPFDFHPANVKYLAFHVINHAMQGDSAEARALREEYAG